MFSKSTLWFLFFLISSFQLFATDYYVSNAGDNTNSGLSLSNAFLTLQHASDQVVAGDNVFVENGSYAGFDHRSASGTSSAPITFKALGNNVLISQPGPIRDDGINVEGTDYIIIDGFISNNMPGSGNGIRMVLANNCILRNNRCDNNAERGIFTGFTNDILIEKNACSNSIDEHGIYVSNSSDRPIIRYNSCFGNNGIGIHLNADASIGGDGIISDAQIYNNFLYENNGGAGINMDGVQSPVVYNNIILNNHFAQGIALFQQDGAIVTNDAKIFNNTILVPPDGRWGILVKDGANVNTEIYNNIIINQHAWRGCIAIENTSQFSSDHNILNDKMSDSGDGSTISLSNWQLLGFDTNSQLAGSLSALFVDPINGDFHLANSSQAIDAGTSLPASIVMDDFDNNPRPSGFGFDIGAYEFAQAPSNVPAKVELIIDESTPYHTQASGGSFSPTVTPLILAGDDLSGQIQSVVVNPGATPYASYRFNDAPTILFDGESDFVSNSGVIADFFGVNPAQQYLDIVITFNNNVNVQSVKLYGYNGNSLYNTTGSTIIFPNNSSPSYENLLGNPWETIYASPTSTATNTLTIRASTTYKIHLTEVEITGSTTSAITAPQPTITADWEDFLGNQLNNASLNLFQANTVPSPSGLSEGYYGLNFSCSDNTIPLPQRIPGVSREFGFAVLSTADVPSSLNPDPTFGLVHVDINDPFIKPGFSKTMTTNSHTGTTLNVTKWTNGINTRKAANYLEMPLVVGSFWDTDDNIPITTQQLQDLQTIMEQYFEADTDILNWELGLEENLKKWNKTHYWNNLQLKVNAVKQARDLKNPAAKLIYQIAGTNTNSVGTFLQSTAAPMFDVLALHPYRWNAFPMPETWLSNYLDAVEGLKIQYNLPNLPIWFTEVGAPHDGNPGGLFIQGGNNITGKSYYDGAKFITKLHAIALSKGVEKIIWYNYHDRGPDPTYPEHHFGIVDHWGFPKAAYPAYQTMVNQLHDKSFVRNDLLTGNVHVYEFENQTSGLKTIMSWVYPNGTSTVSLSDLAPDLSSGSITKVYRTDGLPISISGNSVTLMDYPIFIEYQPVLAGPPVLDLYVFLQGPLNVADQQMHDSLRRYSLLPTTDPYSNTYTTSPFSFAYPFVDWVWVELRDSSAPTTLIASQAALLLNNGKVYSVDGLPIDFGITAGSYYIFVEHRNHLPIMSAQPVVFSSGQTTVFDFTTQNSYSGTGSGQIEVIPGVWAMYMGDGASDVGGYDVSVQDKLLWNTQNGNFLQYLPADYNMDGDINGLDNILFSDNFGVFSGVPK